MADAFGMCYYKLLKILLVAVLSFFKEWTPWFLLRVSPKCPTNWAILMYVEKNSTKYHGQCHKNYLLNCLSFSSNMRYVKRSITVVMSWPLPKMLFSNFFPGVTKRMSWNTCTGFIRIYNKRKHVQNWISPRLIRTVMLTWIVMRGRLLHCDLMSVPWFFVCR